MQVLTFLTHEKNVREGGSCLQKGILRFVITLACLLLCQRNAGLMSGRFQAKALQEEPVSEVLYGVEKEGETAGRSASAGCEYPDSEYPDREDQIQMSEGTLSGSEVSVTESLTFLREKAGRGSRWELLRPNFLTGALDPSFDHIPERPDAWME